jgi:hypothetical protein
MGNCNVVGGDRQSTLEILGQVCGTPDWVRGYGRYRRILNNEKLTGDEKEANPR